MKSMIKIAEVLPSSRIQRLTLAASPSELSRIARIIYDLTSVPYRSLQSLFGLKGWADRRCFL
jgi:hypothetical protein